jgi:glycosyltransferase involved in cell wall biosynthesis
MKKESILIKIKEKKNPLVSVIIPALNEEKYIERCLRSIKNQNFDENNFEIIVSDGLSTDNTVKIAKNYADKIVIAKPEGIGFGKNIGAKVSKGEILVFLDADSVANNNLIKSYVKTFSDNSVVGASGPISTHSSSFVIELVYKIWNEWAKISPSLGFLPGFNAAYRKKYFIKVGGFPIDLSTWEDSTLSLKMKRFGKQKFVRDASVLNSARRWDKSNALLFYCSSLLKIILGKKKSVCYKAIR